MRAAGKASIKIGLTICVIIAGLVRTQQWAKVTVSKLDLRALA
jgi:hypothetical protein